MEAPPPVGCSRPRRAPDADLEIPGMLLRRLFLPLLASLAMAAPALAEPQVWAVVVGVDEYVRPSVPRLRYAVADAKLFSQALQESLKVPADHLFVMTSDAVVENDQPRFVNVAYRLGALKQKVHKDDTLIFYFAGHGITVDGEPFLLTEEADNRSSLTLKATSLHGGDLITTLRKCQCGNIWVMLDACRNGPQESDSPRLDATVSSALSQADVGLLQTATMFSCKVGERSWEWDEKKHGCYSYFLVEGLRREAADAQGKVTVQGLQDYVFARVPAVAQKFGSVQTPTMFYGGTSAGQWVLNRVPLGPGAPVGKEDADQSRWVAEREVLQAELDKEKALRVQAEQRARLAESQRQELEQRLALMTKEVTGKSGAPALSSAAQPQPLAYSKGPLGGERSLALETEISRLRAENESLKKRLANFEVESTKVGMSSREVSLESQPMLAGAWNQADSQQLKAESELQQSQDLERSLQLCLDVRQALAQKVTVYQTCYAPALAERPQSPRLKQQLQAQRERLEIQQLLSEVYDARLQAAGAAIGEASDRLQEAQARERKYLGIIENQQLQIEKAERQLAQCQVKLQQTKSELDTALHSLKKLELRITRQKRHAFQTSPEREQFTRILEQILDNTDLGAQQEARELPP